MAGTRIIIFPMAGLAVAIVTWVLWQASRPSDGMSARAAIAADPVVAASAPSASLPHPDAARTEDDLEPLLARGRQGDPSAIAALQELAQAPIYAASSALIALSQVAPEQAAACARALATSGRAQIAAAAALVLAEQGDLAALDAAMVANRVRADGQEDLILGQAVRGLATQRGPGARRLLARELASTVDASLGLAHARQVVAALAAQGDAEAAPALAAYAQRLEAQITLLADNPQARTTLSTFAAEIRSLIVTLTSVSSATRTGSTL